MDLVGCDVRGAAVGETGASAGGSIGAKVGTAVSRGFGFEVGSLVPDSNTVVVGENVIG